MPPSLHTPVVLDTVPRLRDIERRLRACAARGEQPTTTMLADALHETAGAMLMIVEAEERIRAAEDAAARRELRYMDAEVRLSGLLAEIKASIIIRCAAWLVGCARQLWAGCYWIGRGGRSG